MNHSPVLPTTDTDALFRDCTLCPRKCHANRLDGNAGYCGETSQLRAARAALHFWEEPVLSGTNGSGAVFFSGCNLRCIYCQNYSIACGNDGYPITARRLADIFFDLKAQGAHNINLVTGLPFLPHIREALLLAKEEGLDLPVIYNSSGYESVESLSLLDGLIDIYLPDMKYFYPEPGAKYSAAPDYFEVASAAIAEMVRQVGSPVISPQGLMQKGVIVRHLLLPRQTKNAKKVLRYLHETYGEQIYISIMNQYTPLREFPLHPELNQKVSEEEYQRVLLFAERLGITRGFIQEGDTAKESFIPSFHGEGIID